MHCAEWLRLLVIPAMVSVILGACGSSALAETKITPAVILSQRYDSNVFLGPPEFVPGRQIWDLVTTAGANVNVENKSRLGDSVLNVGVNGNVFAYNTDLSFVSTSVFAGSDLSGWMSELLPGLTFRVSDSFQYTPEPPAFLTGGKPGETSDVFSRGIQAVRANTFTNIFLANADYSISRSVGLRTDYSHSFFKVGQIFITTTAGVPVAFFDTQIHSVSTGPTYTFEGGETLFLKYNYMTGQTSGEGVTLPFSAHTLAPEYVSRILPGWLITMSGGATIVEQAGNRTFFSGKLALAPSHDRPTQVRVSVSRQAAPAFFGAGGALISNIAQLSVSHRFSKVLLLTLSGNYAYNVSAPVDSFTFESVTGSALLEYKLTRSTTLGLSQEYNRYSYTGIVPFDRYATILTLKTEWK